MVTDPAGVLSGFLSAPPSERNTWTEWTLPDKLVDSSLAKLRRRLGPVVSVASRGEDLFALTGRRRHVEVYARFTSGGRVSALVIGDGTCRRWASRHRDAIAVTTWVGWVVVALGVTADAWSATRLAAWVTSLAWLGALSASPYAVGIPARSTLGRRLVVALGVIPAFGAASAVRVGSLRGSGTVTSWVLPGAICLACVALTVGVRRPPASATTVPLRFPLGPGWIEVADGGSLLNHHRVARHQAAALDLVTLDDRGTRRSGRDPARLDSYESFDRPVHAPCTGVVIRAVDGFADQEVGTPRPAMPAGNHVLLDAGDFVVLLAHLRAGTVTVRTSDRVRVGDVLGRVGNSGHSDEPHLHIHAERAGEPLDLRFAGIGGPWFRGRRLRVDAASVGQLRSA